MKLEIGDRLAIIHQILPKQGTMVDMTIAKGIEKKLEISSEEIMESRLTQTPTGEIKWDKEKALAKEIDFTDPELAMLKKQVTKMDTEGTITSLALEIAKRIMAV